MAQTSPEAEAFIAWFESQGATVDKTAMGVADIPGYGRGVVALRDLPVSAPLFQEADVTVLMQHAYQADHTLFTIPRDLVLSMRTSSLPEKFGQAEWKKFGLHKGWTGLMLCMLWEEAQGASSKWHGFFRTSDQTTTLYTFSHQFPPQLSCPLASTRQCSGTRTT